MFGSHWNSTCRGIEIPRYKPVVMPRYANRYDAVNQLITWFAVMAIIGAVAVIYT